MSPKRKNSETRNTPSSPSLQRKPKAQKRQVSSPDTIFTDKGIKVTSPTPVSEDGYYKAVPVRCKSWLCDNCRRRKGFALRAKLLEKSNLFKIPRMFTITVAREWFDSPHDAYSRVMGKKFLARLLTKEMGIRRWVWVLEAQEKNGEGWPHWHILMDISDLEGVWYKKSTKEKQRTRPSDISGWSYIPHFFDLEKAQRLLRKWEIGEHCRLSVKRQAFNNGKHAINYITKYLTKPPKRGYPPWMYKNSGIRFYQPSHEIGRLSKNSSQENSSEVNREKERVDCEEDNQETQEEKTNKMFEPETETARPIDRIAACMRKLLFLRYSKRHDRHVVIGPFPAILESVKKAKKSVCIKDFDFSSQQSFLSWGFACVRDVWNFQAKWQDYRIFSKLQEKIEAEKRELLSQWGKKSTAQS